MRQRQRLCSCPFSQQGAIAGKFQMLWDIATKALSGTGPGYGVTL